MSFPTETELLAQLCEQLGPQKIPRHVAVIMDEMDVGPTAGKISD
jgi:hypothetical protein